MLKTSDISHRLATPGDIIGYVNSGIHQIVIMLVGRAAADQFLAYNTNNRRVSGEHVRRYVKEMTLGRWRFVASQGAIVGKDQVLYDGQKRFIAISRIAKETNPGFSIKISVTFNETEDVRTVLDQGEGRRTAQQYSMIFDRRQANKVTSVARAIATTFLGKDVEFWGAEDVRLVHLMFSAEFEWLLERAGAVPRWISTPYLAGFILFYKIDDVAALVAWEAFLTGADLKNGNAILALRNLAIAKSGVGRSSTMNTLSLINKTMNAIHLLRTGTSIAHLQESALNLADVLACHRAAGRDWPPENRITPTEMEEVIPIRPVRARRGLGRQSKNR